MPKNVGSIKTLLSAKMTSKHIKFCKQNTAMPYYVKIHFARHQHNTERTQNRAGYYNHRQLFRPFGGSSVWHNNQRKLWWKISAHSDFCKSPDLEPSTAKSERAWKSPHARKARRGGEGGKLRDYKQSPSFWTYASLSQRKILIGSSMEICQHLSKTRRLLRTLDIITI